MRNLWVLAMALFLAFPAKSQDSARIGDSIVIKDTTMFRLKKSGEKVLSRQADSVRLPAHQLFRTGLDSLMKTHSDSLLQLDSIRNLSVLTAPDSSFRLITWLFPFDNGAYKFYGYLQYFNPSDTSWHVKALNDKHKEIDTPEMTQLRADNWYGALYYDMIIKENFITLLGWNGYHNQLNQKVIDILHFDTLGKPLFGKQVFANYHDSVRRVILEYSNDVSITLEHDPILHEIEVPSQNAFMTSKRTKQVKENMIYFNKLDPIQPMFEGDHRYYVPLSEKMQGFYFDHGKWVFREHLIILSKDVEETQEETLNLKLFSD